MSDTWDERPRQKTLMTTWDEDVWEEIWNVAASPKYGNGLHAKDLVQRLVVAALDDIKSEGPVAAELGRVHAQQRLLREAEKSETTFNRLVKVAMALRRNPNESLYEELVQICNEEEIPVEKVLSHAQTTGIVLDSEAGKSLNDIQFWIAENLKLDEYYEANEIYRAAAAKGWSKGRVRSALHDLGFRTTKRPGYGNRFWWTKSTTAAQDQEELLHSDIAEEPYAPY